jgi:hypothetical protein
MSKRLNIQHVFLETFPDQLEDGILYVSIPFAVCAHLCCCGCGNQVITDISRTGWRLMFDGVSVSLRPSIGNWSFPCKSHYWITNNRIEWLGTWSPARIAAGRRQERRERSRIGTKRATGEPSSFSSDEDLS